MDRSRRFGVEPQAWLSLRDMHETYFPESTAIHSAAYDDETRELIVRLTTGRTYIYRDVEEWEFDGLRSAESAGQYYNLRIKDHHAYTELVEPPLWLGRPRRSAFKPASRRPLNTSRSSRARRLQSRRARRG